MSAPNYERDELANVIRAYVRTKRLVLDAQTRAKFLDASADLWDVERQLETIGTRLLAEVTD